MIHGILHKQSSACGLHIFLASFRHSGEVEIIDSGVGNFANQIAPIPSSI